MHSLCVRRICLSICLYVCLSICLYVCLSICLYVCMCMSSSCRLLLVLHILSGLLSLSLSACLSVCLSVYLSVSFSLFLRGRPICFPALSFPPARFSTRHSHSSHCSVFTFTQLMYLCCLYLCVRACMRACVRACACARVRVCICSVAVIL